MASLSNIPTELTLKIVDYLEVNDVIKLSEVNKVLYTLAISDTVWYSVNQRTLPQIDIDSWTNKLGLDQRTFYSNVARHAKPFTYMHAGNVYPQGHLLRWTLSPTEPISEGQLMYMTNKFKPSEAYTSALERGRWIYVNHANILLNDVVSDYVEAGLQTEVEHVSDLVVKFTGSAITPAVALDVESGEEKAMDMFKREAVETEDLICPKSEDDIEEDDLRMYPYHHLIPFLEQHRGRVSKFHFKRPYPWPEDEPLETIPLNESRTAGSATEGYYSGTYGGHGIEVLAAKRINSEDGRPLLEFVKVTGDDNVPRGLVSMRVFLDQEVKDSELVNDEGRLSSDDNLPWPIDSPTRPAGVSFAGVGKIAHSSYTSPSWTNVIVHIENEDLVYARWTDLRNTLIMKRFV